MGINDGGGWEIDEAKWRDGGIRRRSEDEDKRGRGDEGDGISAHQDI